MVHWGSITGGVRWTSGGAECCFWNAKSLVNHTDLHRPRSSLVTSAIIVKVAGGLHLSAVLPAVIRHRVGAVLEPLLEYIQALDPVFRLDTKGYEGHDRIDQSLQVLDEAGASDVPTIAFRDVQPQVEATHAVEQLLEDPGSHPHLFPQ